MIPMETLFLELLNMALSATWIMMAVLVFRAVFKRWLPRRAVILCWILVAVRLICPFTPESVISLIPSGRPIPSDIPYAETPGVDLGIELIERPVNDFLAGHLSPSPEVSTPPLQILTSVAGWIWLAGVVALLTYATVAYACLRRRVRLAVKMSGERSLPRRATLWQSEAVDSPFILGILKPRIYLPFGMDSETSGHVLAHESAHLRRLDHIIKPIAFLVCAVYWYHPLVWVCYGLFCRDMEAACDEAVVKDMDEVGRRAYAHALLTCEGRRQLRPFCPPAFGETDVRSRIKGVLSYKKPFLWLIVVAVLILAVLAVLLLTDPVKESNNIPSDLGMMESYPSVSTLEGFSIHPVRTDISAEDELTVLEMKLVNNTGKSVGYGEPFKIFREERGEWVDAAVSDTFFHLPMYYLEDGEEISMTYDVSHYDLSMPGYYMFSISVTAPINEYGATNDYEVRWFFTIKDLQAMATPHPADFAIRFSSQTGAVPDVLDTFDGYIQKDLIAAIPNQARTAYKPTEEELQYLWYLVESHGITSMPSDMHAVQTGDIHVSVDPNTEYKITVRANGYTYTVRGDTVTGLCEGEMNEEFRSFVSCLQKYLYSTDQWKSLPDAKGGYA